MFVNAGEVAEKMETPESGFVETLTLSRPLREVPSHEEGATQWSPDKLWQYLQPCVELTSRYLQRSSSDIHRFQEGYQDLHSLI
jgi:hypothetical protein